MKEFVGFLKQYGVIGLAIAVVIVAAVVFFIAKTVLGETVVTKK